MSGMDRREFMAAAASVLGSTALPEQCAAESKGSVAPEPEVCNESDAAVGFLPPICIPPGESRRVVLEVPAGQDLWATGVMLDSDDKPSLAIRRILVDGRDLNLAPWGAMLSVVCHIGLGREPVHKKLEIEICNIDQVTHRVWGHLYLGRGEGSGVEISTPL